MKLHFLRYFVVLAEELHFGRAAERLAITQPPLSSAIKAMEEELQVQLLLRSSKRVELTPAGSAFRDEARSILERVASAMTLAKAVATGLRGRLEVGMAGSLIYREIPLIVNQYKLDNPGIDLVLREMSSAEAVDALLHGQVQGAFINAGAVPPQLKALRLLEDEFILCLPVAHPLAQQEVIQLGDLSTERFVMFSRDVAPANHDSVIAIFNRHGIHPETVHAARQWLTIVAMVANDLGVSIVPRSIARSRVHGVSFIRFSGPPAAAQAMLAWNPNQTSAALEAFLDTAAKVIRHGSSKRQRYVRANRQRSGTRRSSRDAGKVSQ